MRNTSSIGIVAALAIASVFATGVATAGEWDGSFQYEYAQQQKVANTAKTQAASPSANSAISQ